MGRGRVLLPSFLAGACLMTAELAAPRLTAPHLGTGVLAWIAAIGTFLGGLALGSGIGGRLADRAPRGLVPACFGAGAVLLALAVPLDGLLAAGLRPLPHPARVLLVVPIEFLGVAVALGAVTPALARAALGRDDLPGRAIGGVWAANAAGSVAGTFLAGFTWIPAVGTRALILGTGGALVLSSALALRAGPPLPRRATPPPARGALRSGFAALAALSGGTLLAFEVAIGRIAAERIGSSVFTWTSVIGVVLLGIAAGSALGGRLADRHPPRALLAALLLVASAGLAVCLWSPLAMRPALAVEGPSYALRTLLSVAVAFLLPAVALGTLSPAVLRAALADPGTDGRVVGRLSAIGSAGAVVAAGLAGFVLIPAIGIRPLLALLAFALAVAAAFVRGRPHLPWLVATAALAALAGLPVAFARDEGIRLHLRDDEPGVWVRDSRYMRVRVAPFRWRWFHAKAPPSDALAGVPALAAHVVFDGDRDIFYWDGPMSEAEEAGLRPFFAAPEDREALADLRRRTGHVVKVLTLDRITHGYVDLDDPLWYGYEYEAVYSDVVDRAWPATADAAHPVRALFLGAGPFGFPRRMKAQHGAALRSVTAEIDPDVVRAGREALGLADGVTDVVEEDARTYVLRLGANDPPFDLVFGDAFDDLSVPWHLTTIEFAREVKAHLTPNGVYLVNLIDRFDSGRFVGAFLRTLERAFGHVALLSAAPRQDDAQQTFVLVASDRDLDLSDLPGAVLYGPSDLARLRAREGPPVLTDDHAPVEALLAPVVSARDTR